MAFRRMKNWGIIGISAFILSACGGGGGGGGASSAPAPSSYSVSGTISGLAAGSKVVLSNNTSDVVTVSSNGSFSFNTPIASNGSYNVAIATQPTGLACSVANGAGTNVSASVTDVVVSCASATETVLGTGVFASTISNAKNNMIAGSDGNIYATNGMACPEILKITPGGTSSVFASMPCTNGEITNLTSLIQASDGNFYATAYNGGTYSAGGIYKITPSGTATVLYTFGQMASDAANPISLIQGSDGNLYGLSYNGGSIAPFVCPTGDTSCAAPPLGTVFKVTLSGQESVLYSFGASSTDAATPVTLIQGNDGNLYGVTIYGGQNGSSHCNLTTSCVPGYGTLFKLSTAGQETILYSFGAGNDGIYPVGLMQASDGNLYGTTSFGGTNGSSNCASPSVPSTCVPGDGTFFKMSLSGTETLLYSFGGVASDGISPSGAFVQGNDGNFYGATIYGGANSTPGMLSVMGAYWINNNATDGTIFKITPTGTESVLYSFGSNPGDAISGGLGLMLGPNGSLYGFSNLNDTAPNCGSQCGTGVDETGAFYVFGAY